MAPPDSKLVKFINLSVTDLDIAQLTSPSFVVHITVNDLLNRTRFADHNSAEAALFLLTHDLELFVAQHAVLLLRFACTTRCFDLSELDCWIEAVR